MPSKIKKLLTLLVITALFVGISRFCQYQTKGFRPYMILSNLPNDPRWEVPPLSEEEQVGVDALLGQRFTYLGSGGWCIAFLGEDKETVLKFFRHTHLYPSQILRAFTCEKLFNKSLPLPMGTSYFQEFNFKSCTLLYQMAKERTGMLYLHLNKTEGQHRPVILIDNIGVQHTINLDQTEFVVQKRADLIFPHIRKLVREGRIEEAKQCLSDMAACLLTLYTQGIRDYDHSMKNNFGFIDGKAVTLDLSSFGIDPSLMRPGEYRKELIIKTRRLSRYLNKNHPDLYQHFESHLSELMESL